MKLRIADFKTYYKNHFGGELLDIGGIEDEIEAWKYYRDKILKRELNGFEYNSSKDNFVGCEHRSLQNFIERKTPTLGGYGPMISGRMVLWIEGIDKEATWHSRKKDENGKIVDEVLKTEVQRKEFEKEINNYLYRIVSCTKFDDLIIFLNNNNDHDNLTRHYGARNFVEKIVELNSFLDDSYDYYKKLIFIYDFSNVGKIELIDRRGNNVLEPIKEKKDNLEKNKFLTEKILDILEIDKPEIQDLVKIQRCLWELTESKEKDLILSNEKKNIIFYGAPGTGKTYAAKKVLSVAESVVVQWVQFHPGFTYEDFIEGIKPVGIDGNGNLKLSVVNGCFKDFCIRAKNDPDRQYYFVADEINRANLSSVFGETLSLLENSYRWNDSPDEDKKNVIYTPLSKVIQKMLNDAMAKNNKEEIEDVEKLIFDFDENGDVVFGVPDNIHFIGMMNDADKSIDTFDLALRRRFVWVRKDFDELALEKCLLFKGVNEEHRKEYIGHCKKLNYFITGNKYGNGKEYTTDSLGLGQSFEIGHAIFMDLDDEYISKSAVKKEGYLSLWREHLESTLREYLRSSLPENEIEPNLAKARDIFTK